MRQGSSQLPGAGFLLALLAAAFWLLEGDLTSEEAGGESGSRSEWVFLDIAGSAHGFVRVEPGESLGRILEREAPGLRTLLPRYALDVPLEGGERISVLGGVTLASPLLVVEPLPERVRFLLGRSLNLNRATAEEMELLPGVGPKLGGRIEAFRKVSGQFCSPDDLLAVPGVGRALVSKMRDRICFAQRVWSFPLLSPGRCENPRRKTHPEILRSAP